MMAKQTYNIALLPGDGIGPEVLEPAVDLLDAALAQSGDIRLSYSWLEAGAAHFAKTGESLPERAMETARESHAIFLGAMGLPSIRYPDGTEIAPQLELRETLDLFAGVRPIRSIPGIAPALADPRAAELDFVLVRESTEGLFKSRGKCQLEGDEVARDTLEITRHASERLFEFSFALAERRKDAGFDGRLTCIDKANVLGSFAFFRKIFAEIAEGHPEVVAEYGYIDAAGLMMVKRPWDFDVLVTENMFGDILSDIGAALMGGMGMAPSADIGSKHAVFQPCHGSAPDIAGQGKANPVATILSGAMMLDWLADGSGLTAFRDAGQLLNDSVDDAFRSGDLLPYELGGDAGTREIIDAVSDTMNARRDT